MRALSEHVSIIMKIDAQLFLGRAQRLTRKNPDRKRIYRCITIDNRPPAVAKVFVDKKCDSRLEERRMIWQRR